jgi:hypothetical protein
LLVTPNNRNVTTTAGTTNFTVASNTTWTATSGAGWCTVTPSGTGNGTIDAVYEQNTALDPRVAVITITVNGLTPVNVTVSQDGTVGMPEVLASNILLFPNPNDGKFAITTANKRNIDLTAEVFSVTGKLVATYTCEGQNRYTFDLSTQPKGSYILKIRTREGIFSKTVIIE